MAIAYRIIEDYLCLEHKASTRYASAPPPGSLTSVMPSLSMPGRVSMSPVEEDHEVLPLRGYTGKYTNAGYPTVVLCDPATSRDTADCQPVLHAFSLLEDLSARDDTLYCAFPNLWVSHARMRRLKGNVFDLTATYIFPEGYGRDKSPFETSETGQTGVEMRFLVEDGSVKGFGISGLVGETTEIERIGGTIKQIAEIWYDRAQS